MGRRVVGPAQHVADRTRRPRSASGVQTRHSRCRRAGSGHRHRRRTAEHPPVAERVDDRGVAGAVALVGLALHAAPSSRARVSAASVSVTCSSRLTEVQLRCRGFEAESGILVGEVEDAAGQGAARRDRCGRRPSRSVRRSTARRGRRRTSRWPRVRRPRPDRAIAAERGGRLVGHPGTVQFCQLGSVPLISTPSVRWGRDSAARAARAAACRERRVGGDRKLVAAQHVQRVVLVPAHGVPPSPPGRAVGTRVGRAPAVPRWRARCARASCGALGHRAVVHVAQRQHAAVVLGQSRQDTLGHDPVELGVPVVGGLGRFGEFGHRHAEPVVAAPEMVGELVPGHPDQPRHVLIGAARLAGRRPSPPGRSPRSGPRRCCGQCSGGRSIRTPRAALRRTASSASDGASRFRVRRSHPYRRRPGAELRRVDQDFFDPCPGREKRRPGLTVSNAPAGPASSDTDSSASQSS